MASYATYLLSGQTLLCCSIKVGTAKAYLKAVSDLFTTRDYFDPCIDKFGTRSSYLQAVYSEAKRWESMPNRQEGITIEMVE